MQTTPSQAAAQADLLAFLQNYNEYLHEVLNAQNEKLEALLSHEVELIEKSAVQQQSMTLKMQNLEEQRAKLQVEAGWEGLTFREIEQVAPSNQRQAYQQCREEMDRLLEQIQFLNGKAMHLVETDLKVIDLSMPLQGRLESQGYTEDGKQREAADQVSLLDSKI